MCKPRTPKLVTLASAPMEPNYRRLSPAGSVSVVRVGAGGWAGPYAGLSPDKQLLIPSAAPFDEYKVLGSFPKLTSVGGAFKISQRQGMRCEHENIP